MKSKTAEEILDEKFLRVEAADWYIPVLTAMEEYASQFQHPVPDEAGRYKYLLEDFKEQYGRWYKPSFEMQSTAVPTDYTKDWTNDANEAMKWDNKLDAINFRDKIFKDMDGYEITEHEFVSPAPPSGEGAGKGWISEIDKARFWIKVSQTETCWEWLGAKNNDGYGNFRIGSDYISAHKCSFKIINGDVPDNLCVLHSCDNPSCVNPTHLFLGTHDDNMKDKVAKGRSRVQGKSSKYIGVGLRNDSNTWRAYYYNNGKMQWIGTYKTELEAAKERDKYIIENNIKEKLNFNN